MTGSRNRRSQRLMVEILILNAFADGDSHMTTISASSSVAFVLADATFDSDACILATSTGSLAVAALLAFATPLTSRLRRQIFLVRADLVVKVGGRCNGAFARLRGE